MDIITLNHPHHHFNNNNNNNKRDAFSATEAEERIYLYTCKVCGMLVPVLSREVLLELLLHIRKTHHLRMYPDTSGIKQYFTQEPEEV
jgi:hypothetical protein